MTVQFDFMTTLLIDGQQSGTPQKVSVTGGGEYRLRPDVPIAVDTQYEFACTIAKLKALRIEADGVLDIYTNAIHSGAFDQHFTLVPNQPILWNNKMGTLNPLTVNVVTIYITNASAAVVKLQIDKLEDPAV